MYKRFTMQENLVIVESPAKAKTIEKFLGKDFMVKSSFGHIRDLSKKDLGINLADGFAPVYEIPKDKRKVVDELTRAAKDRTVWLASDEDREGEAIAWHLTEVLGLPGRGDEADRLPRNYEAGHFEAIENPRTVDMNLVNAQQARRVLDRLVGFELSPVLWKKVRPSLSAGRVQSVAVRLLVEREREIIAFRSTPYFRVVAQFHAAGDKDRTLFNGRAADALRVARGGRGVPPKLRRRDLHGGQGRREARAALSRAAPSRPPRCSRRRGASWGCRFRRPCPSRSTSTSRVSSPTCVPTR